MSNSEPLLTPTLVIVCVVMAGAAGLVSRLFLRGSLWPAPIAGVRAAVQLAAVAMVLAAAMSRLWSSMLVLSVMFMVASVTAARRNEASRGSMWLAAALAAGMAAVIPLLLLSRVVPLSGVALVPVFGIVLGGTMTAAAISARRALDALTLRARGGRGGPESRSLRTGLADGDHRAAALRRAAAQPGSGANRRSGHTARRVRRGTAGNRLGGAGRSGTGPRPRRVVAVTGLRGSGDR